MEMLHTRAPTAHLCPGGSVGSFPFLEGRVCLGQGRRWACRGLCLSAHSHT